MEKKKITLRAFESIKSKIPNTKLLQKIKITILVISDETTEDTFRQMKS
jgi:hypothetical protein